MASHALSHQHVHTSVQPYDCPYCGEEFDSSRGLRQHRWAHPPSSCSHCDKRACGLQEQQRIHTREKPFVRAECGKGFIRMSSLWQHWRTHSGDRPFPCLSCGKGFTRLDHLLEHRRAHTGQRPFTCPLCGKAFARSSSLLAHRHVER